MTIKEIEALSGMSRANIRYYEREGLLSPHREVNGYRDYSEADLAALKRIQLLRRLDISLEQIKALQVGQAELAQVLADKADGFAQMEQDTAFAQRACRSLLQDGVTYATLDAQKYLDAIPEPAFEHGFFTPRSIDLEQVAYPWRRYLARTLDLSIYETVWLSFLVLAFRTNLASQSRLFWIFSAIVALALMLFMEPLMLRLFGATLGKAVFSLRLEDENGSKPDYYSGFVRTWDVIQYGFGYGIPFYSVYTLWKSFRRCEDRKPQPWNNGLQLTIRDTIWYRGAGFAGANLLLIGILMTTTMAARIPPNRGELTIAAFAENYNTLADYFGVFYHRLNTDGHWTMRTASNTIDLGADPMPWPEFEYTLQDGRISAIRWQNSADGGDLPIMARDMEMALAALAFVGAQPDVGLWSRLRYDLFALMASHRFSDYTVTEAGITLSQAVTHSGYIIAGQDKVLIPVKGQTTQFSRIFLMERITRR